MVAPAQRTEQRLLWAQLWRQRGPVERATGIAHGVFCSGRFAFAGPVAGRNAAVLSPALKTHRSG